MISTQWPEVVVVGCACIDVKGRPVQSLMAGTSNPGEIKMSVGGSGRNIADNLARLGTRVALVTAVSDDAFGRMILEKTTASGADVSESIIVPDSSTDTYLAVLSSLGKMIVSVDDIRVISALTPAHIRERHDLFSTAKMLVMDPNPASRTISATLSIARRHRLPVCVNPVSIPLAQKIKPWLKYCSIITCDVTEAEALVGKHAANVSDVAKVAQRLLSFGLDIAIVTMRREGLFYATGEASGHVPSVRCEVRDITGAGDALTAGVVYGLVNGFPIDEAVRLGASASAITLMSDETVSPHMGLEYLYQTMPT